MAGPFIYGPPDPRHVAGWEQTMFNRCVTRTCAILGIEPAMVFAPVRPYRIVKTRQWLMTVAKLELEWTHHQVGSFFKRDHSTVVHAVKEIRNGIDAGNHGQFFDNCGRACAQAFEEIYQQQFQNLG